MVARSIGSSERGAALLIVITLVLMLGAISAAVAIASRTETLLAAGFRQGRETAYAAEGAVALAVRELASISEWNAVLTGAVTASFTDGAAIGTKTLFGGEPVTLCCGRPSATDDVQQRAFGGRDWGDDTPQWQIFAWGPVARWLPAGRIDSALYVTVWVADDGEDGDRNPFADSNGILLVHGQARGPAGSRRILEAAIRRQTIGEPAAPGPGVHVLTWQEIRW